MAGTSTASSLESLNSSGVSDRLKTLYPAVHEESNPLPRTWSTSSKDKYTSIGLSSGNLRVHYKGQGKSHKDAASVRTNHPIPAACGIYYFEVKIISKGRDGYMGVGLSVQGVNMNRLPGWDKHSYGYHGDDGYCFASSSTGQPYGPTFTTNDVIGCCINFIDNTCFYTKNGVHLGVAFRELAHNLHPTVGLQTPGEVVEANFGQAPFVFDIEDYMREWKAKTRQTIERLPVPDRKGEWQGVLQKVVATYLVHHGYSATAEKFANQTGQRIIEKVDSIRNRQRIQHMVLSGRIGEAILTTRQLYPGLLEQKTGLLFTLLCRQFIEMVNGTEGEMRGVRSPRSLHGSARSSPCASPSHVPGLLTSQTGSPRTAQSPARAHSVTSSDSSSPSRHGKPPALGGAMSRGASPAHAHADSRSRSEAEMNALNLMNGASGGGEAMNGARDSDEEMEDLHVSNGFSTNGVAKNGVGGDEHMDVDRSAPKRFCSSSTQAATDKLIQFGRDLHAMIGPLRMSPDGSRYERVLHDAFALLAYNDPWCSPMAWQLDPVQREPVCAALNSAILEKQGLPRQPPLELALGQATQTIHLMSKVGIGACAFAQVQDYVFSGH